MDDVTCCKPVRVIALGSPNGDDRLAWAVVDRLRQLPEFDQVLSDRVSLVECDRPGAILVEHLAAEGFALIVDALVDGGPPGRILRVDSLRRIPLSDTAGSHGFGLADSLRLAEMLGCLRAPWLLLGITIEPPTVAAPADQPLSPAVADAIETLARMIAMELSVEIPLPA